MKLSLVVLNAGKSSGQVIPVNLAQFVIGRDAQCNLRPGSALISKRHCAVLVRNDEVFVRDFDSTNGTMINETPLKGEVGVKNGDILKVGPLQFRVNIEDVPTKHASKTPTPTAASPKKPTPTPAPKGGHHDDDVAALLLGMDGDTAFGAKDESSVPDGSTIMDMPIDLAKAAQQAAQPAAETSAPAAANRPTPPGAAKKKEEEKKKIDVGTAQAAAKAILERFGKRPR